MEDEVPLEQKQTNKKNMQNNLPKKKKFWSN